MCLTCVQREGQKDRRTVAGSPAQSLGSSEEDVPSSPLRQVGAGGVELLGGGALMVLGAG